MAEALRADRPPQHGRLLIIEPFVPEGQWDRRIRAIGPTGHEIVWEFEVDEPLGWKGASVNRVLLRPRGGSEWIAQADGTFVCDGVLETGPGTQECLFIGQVQAAPATSEWEHDAVRRC